MEEIMLSDMTKPNFGRLTGLSENVKASSSDIAWREFLVANWYFVNYCSYRVKEDEIGDITKSLQNWSARRGIIVYQEKDSSGNRTEYSVKKGEIYLADMGMSYELAYAHPVLILDELDNKVLIVPATTSNKKLSIAYDPIESPQGNRMYRKVGKVHGFDDSCALMLNNIQLISKGRLLERKGVLKEDISLPQSLYSEIRTTLFKMYFTNFYEEMDMLRAENDDLKKRLDSIEKSNSA